MTVTNTFGATGLLSRTNSTGAVLSSDLYDAYGKQLAGASDVYGFEAQAGYRTDPETGLLLLTHRYYDPATGRFVTRDPIGYDGGVNLYGYTQNNPVNGMDPSGLMGPPLALGGGTLLGAGGATVGETALGAVALPVAAGAATAYVFWHLGTPIGNWIADHIPGQDGLPPPVLPIIANKPAFPDRALPRDDYGRSIPDAPYPHTQLGRRDGRKGKYPQSREWGADGQPNCQKGDIDWTDHGRPSIPGHTVPHRHPTGPGGQHGPAEPLNPDGTVPE